MQRYACWGLTLVVLCLTASAGAEVIATGDGTQDTTAPVINSTTITGWNNVGSFTTTGYDASAVYIGNGWVLGAYHPTNGSGNGANIDFEAAPSGNFSNWNGGTTYTLKNPDGTNADLLLWNVGTVAGLSNITFASASPTYGQEVISIGYGEIRNTPAVTVGSTGNPGFAETPRSPLERTWGDNRLTDSYYDNSQLIYEYASTSSGTYVYSVNGIQTQFEPYGAPNTDSEEVQIAPGDSGGALFNDAGQLIGINDGELEQAVGYATYGDYSIYSYLSPYYVNQIYNISGVPEPACGIMLLGGIATLGMRRRGD